MIWLVLIQVNSNVALFVPTAFLRGLLSTMQYPSPPWVFFARNHSGVHMAQLSLWVIVYMWDGKQIVGFSSSALSSAGLMISAIDPMGSRKNNNIQFFSTSCFFFFAGTCSVAMFPKRGEDLCLLLSLSPPIHLGSRKKTVESNFQHPGALT